MILLAASWLTGYRTDRSKVPTSAVRYYLRFIGPNMWVYVDYFYVPLILPFVPFCSHPA